MDIYDPIADALNINPSNFKEELIRPEKLINPGQSELMKIINKKRIEEGTHHLLSKNGGSESARKENLKRVNNKTHPFMKGGSYYNKKEKENLNPFKGEAGSKMIKKLLEEGRHTSQIIRKCPHCDKEGRSPGIFKHHFNNCQLVKISNTLSE